MRSRALTAVTLRVLSRSPLASVSFGVLMTVEVFNRTSW